MPDKYWIEFKKIKVMPLLNFLQQNVTISMMIEKDIATGFPLTFKKLLEKFIFGLCSHFLRGSFSFGLCGGFLGI